MSLKVGVGQFDLKRHAPAFNHWITKRGMRSIDQNLSQVESQPPISHQARRILKRIRFIKDLVKAADSYIDNRI